MLFFSLFFWEGEQHEVGLRGRDEHPKARITKKVGWARKGEGKVRRGTGPKSTTRHGANLEGELLPRHPGFMR